MTLSSYQIIAFEISRRIVINNAFYQAYRVDKSKKIYIIQYKVQLHICLILGVYFLFLLQQQTTNLKKKTKIEISNDRDIYIHMPLQMKR